MKNFRLFKKKIYFIPLAMGFLAVAMILISIFWVIEYKTADPVIKAKEISHNTGLEILKSKRVTELNPNLYFAPILVFHHIAMAPEKLDNAGKNLFVKPARLEQILADLNKSKYIPAFASEIASYIAKGQKAPKNMVALTFDDGYEDFYTNAWPLLQKYNIKSSLYIITEMNGGDYLTRKQIVELDKSGLVEIGSHSVSHPYLTKLGLADQLKQLQDSKNALEKLLNKKITIICYPYGSYNQQIINLAKQIGYVYGLTYNHLPLEDTKNQFAIDRVGVWPAMDVLGFLRGLNLNIK